MGSYTIIGGFSVAGKTPGEIVTDDELGDTNIPVLIEAGCLAPTKTPKTPSPSTEEQ